MIILKVPGLNSILPGVQYVTSYAMLCYAMPAHGGGNTKLNANIYSPYVPVYVSRTNLNVIFSGGSFQCSINKDK